ncbi:hypothetical protein ymoll0001_40580 [Yersinia mollaretii ATCC 43969]|uniref:Uncharacterized protein n=1 Tax=Yersinia mollaretii (strain ATCC 43969 / DSM 18520 / CIP 103324 / CNY 7263 / WAIP 204) TaxID=349967 RepID=A0ABM9Y4G1_YERMW|nr:hypothetical protein ymoll0001_40580 [Yersinia mollaretii ATCC 43969]
MLFNRFLRVFMIFLSVKLDAGKPVCRNLLTGDITNNERKI